VELDREPGVNVRIVLVHTLLAMIDVGRATFWNHLRPSGLEYPQICSTDLDRSLCKVSRRAAVDALRALIRHTGHLTPSGCHTSKLTDSEGMDSSFPLVAISTGSCGRNLYITLLPNQRQAPFLRILQNDMSKSV
jgi:hypothetical protein